MSYVLPDSIRCRVGYLLAKSHQRQLALFEKHTNRFAVSGREYAALLALEANDGLWQSDIAELLGMDRTTVTYLVDSLEKRGWLIRARDPADRRAHVITMTDEGVAALAAIRPAARSSTDELLSPLTSDEREQLRSLLSRITAS